MTEPEEQAVDSLLLGMLKTRPSGNLSILSRELGLPRSQIMKRIEQLYQDGFLKIEGGSFYLTKEGFAAAVSPDIFSRLAVDDRQPDFDWENCNYLPTPESFAE